MLPIAILVLLPVLVFGVPALLGHSVLPGDDLLQNYPLRVLAGRQIAAGHLPVFDPYIWSGAPLLADWNAGAAYPLTLLFAVLPGAAAWALNLIVTYVVAGVGMFWFLRAQRLGSLACFLGALTFAFAGSMPAQVGHIGLVAGMSWLPLELLAVFRLTEGRDRASRLRWVCVLAAAFGLTILAGEPRAIDNAGLILLIYAAWRIGRIGRGRAGHRSPEHGSPEHGSPEHGSPEHGSPGRGSPGRGRPGLGSGYGPAVVSVLAGLGLGACIGAVQLLPGLSAVSSSQRAASSWALYTSGSLPVKWLLMLFVPDVLGGSGSFGQPAFLGNYNLAEVTSYVGILPLVAAAALLGRLRLRQRPPEWVVWHVIALVGIVCALGGKTPFGHLLVHLPLFGDQRLQSRNIAVLDMALAVLFAYWVDDPFGARSRAGEELSRRRAALQTGLGLLPPLAILALIVVGVTWPAGLVRWLGISDASGASVRLVPGLGPYALLALVAIGLVIFGERLSRQRPKLWSRLLAGFVAADLVVFTVFAVVAVAAGIGRSAGAPAGVAPDGGPAGAAAAGKTKGAPAAPALASPAHAIAQLGYRGRYAIYDPGLIDESQLATLGAPDINVLSATPSSQGYSSLVDGRYAAATGSHQATGEGQDVLAPSAVANGTLASLDTSVLLTPRQYLVTSPGGSPALVAPGSGRRDVAAHQPATWFLGGPIEVARLVVPDAAAARDAAAGAQLGLMAPDGSTTWYPATAVGVSTLAVSPATPVLAVAVTSRTGASTGTSASAGAGTAQFGTPTIVTSGGATLAADGQLQGALVPPQWGYAGTDGSVAVFANPDARGPLSVASLAGRPTAGALVTAISGPADEPTAAAVSSPDGVRVIRSVAAIPGWTATWQPRHGAPTALIVHRAGVVQAVDVPAGGGVVTWSYRPPELAAGLAVSLAGVLVFLALLLVARRSRRRSPPLAGHGENGHASGPVPPLQPFRG